MRADSSCRPVLETTLNKRDFMKGTAALAAAPAILAQSGAVSAAMAEQQRAFEARADRGPTPSYIFDSTKRTMRFYRADTDSFRTFAYMMAA